MPSIDAKQRYGMTFNERADLHSMSILVPLLHIDAVRLIFMFTFVDVTLHVVSVIESGLGQDDRFPKS